MIEQNGSGLAHVHQVYFRVDPTKKFLHTAWQPLTFGGVASFAHARLKRLLAVELAVASLVAASVVWCLSLTWFADVRLAITRLPDEAAIRQGQLEWPDGEPVRLVESEFLSILVDPNNLSDVNLTSDLQVELGRDEWRIRSLFGYVPLRYPTGWSLPLNRAALQPWWGAWQWVILVGVAVAVVVGLLLQWAVLAVVYLAPVRLAVFFLDREASRAGCWRLASAALMPGAVVMSGAIFLYGIHRLPLVGLLLAVILHLLVGWVYLVIAPFKLPKKAAALAAEKTNPFAPRAP